MTCAHLPAGLMIVLAVFLLAVPLVKRVDHRFDKKYDNMLRQVRLASAD